MGTGHGALASHRCVTPDVLDWYARFARGRPGVLVVEATGIRDIRSGPLLRIGDDRFIPGLRELARVVREESRGHTRLFIQIIDFLTVRRRPTPEAFFSRHLLVDSPLRYRLGVALNEARWGEAPEAEIRARLSRDRALAEAVLSPRDREALDFGYRERVWDLHLPHVRELPRVLPALFAEAARRAQDAGFDGVELHYAHAYTTNYCEGLDQRHKQVTCKLWDRELTPDDPTLRLASDGKRRLNAPPWRPPEEE